MPTVSEQGRADGEGFTWSPAAEERLCWEDQGPALLGWTMLVAEMSQLFPVPWAAGAGSWYGPAEQGLLAKAGA